MTVTQLELGAQGAAARLVYDALPPIAAALDDLAGQLEAGLAGLRGATGAGLTEAVAAWFAAAQALVPVLAGYGTNLAEVDRTIAASQALQAGLYEHVATRLEGLP